MLWSPLAAARDCRPAPFCAVHRCGAASAPCRGSVMLKRNLRALVAALIIAGVASAEELSKESTEFFEKKIRPVLVEHCYECHSAQSEKLKGKLLLDNRESARKGGETGPAVVPGDADSSLLVQALRYENFEMPPKGKLPTHVIADFEKWIKEGAADPREAAAASPAI